jgi:hypothetical protein
MRIVLDQEQWDVSSDSTLLDTLTQVSDKAHARQRVVTALRVGGRALTDRDLQPDLLARPLQEVGEVEAISQALQDLLAQEQETLRWFAGIIRDKAQELIRALRVGPVGFSSFDNWCGQLADYAEYVEAARRCGVAITPPTSLTPVLTELLNARAEGDAVRIADLLQYELVPALPG